jgi:hypothetical protein
MRRLTRRLMVGAAFLAVALAALASTPAEARFFHRFGFGFGFPVVYAPPPVVPVYVPPPVYAVYPPPVAYRYRVYRTYRRVTHGHVVHDVAHHRWCGCSCCR